MTDNSKYIEHEGKAVIPDARFKHVMSITLDPRTNYQEGVIRCITSRDGDIAIKGTVDRSELHRIKGNSSDHFEIGDKLTIKNEEEIISKLMPEGYECIGLEDPDIWIDQKNDLMHLYFTIAIIIKDKKTQKQTRIHLGHAVGKNLDSLEMTEPVLFDNENRIHAKEVSIAPKNSKGLRYNLIESRDRRNNTTYSVVKMAIVKDMGESWEYGETVFNPADHQEIKWIAGHASPGPLLSKNFINVGEGKLLGIINGREANQKIGDKIKYGMFSVGLFIYDYENGKIDWVSPEPFIQDSEALTITFASQFVETGRGEGILYAHVDDSFVRAYTLKAELLKSLLPK